MPRFPVTFGRRKSTADNLENVSVVEQSFRVLERSEVAGDKSFDGGARLAAKAQTMPRTTISDITSVDDNIFADLKNNRGSGSGSSNTTKTTSTDNSSRHSNTSTTPSSADLGGQDDWRGANKRAYADIPVPPIPKSNSSGFLKNTGRSWSFGGQKKHLPPLPVAEEPLPETLSLSEDQGFSGRARATTTSTTSTATPPKLEQDFTLDLGGDFGNMIMGFDKRGSVATVRDDGSGRQALVPRSLTGNRLNQPTPIQVDRNAKVEASPYSWGSLNSHDQLLTLSPTHLSGNENTPPPPKHGSPRPGRPVVPASGENGLKRTSAVFGKRRSTAEPAEAEDEDSKLLKDSISTVSKFLSGSTTTHAQSGRYRRNEDMMDSSPRQNSAEFTPSRSDMKGTDENLFDVSLAQSSRIAHRYVTRKASPPRNKVMTPAQFERYRQDKERQGARTDAAKPEQDNDEDDNYEDDEDEIEKSKQAAKQRRKQEAHMTVYRQQMMKVTGESNGTPARPSMPTSFSTPNLGSIGGGSGPGVSPTGGSDGSDEDEEVPLAILAAHGFPNKNRPPTRLSSMMSNPNLRAAAATPSYQRPGSVVGDAPGAAAGGNGGGNGGRLPPFARNLPQDPYLGAGLVNPSVRESLSFGGGAPAAGPANAPLPPGGLVGVIANEERSRAMRRGSPAVDMHKPMLPMNAGPSFDPLAGIPHQMMYPGMPATPVLTPGDQAQIQMTQQMQQFMQMQMQFMQMMATNANGGTTPQVPGAMPLGPFGMGTPDTMRHSFVDNGSVMDLPLVRPDSHVRSMSMVQPSSASWIQPPANAGYAPSIRIQGTNGYAPSIAPSERSNIGLPGRYRPVSQAPPPMPAFGQIPKSSTMSGALGGWDQVRKQTNKSPLQRAGANSDDDDEEGWEAMKAKRDKKKSLWKTKKSLGSELGAFIR